MRLSRGLARLRVPDRHRGGGGGCHASVPGLGGPCPMPLVWSIEVGNVVLIDVTLCLLFLVLSALELSFV